MAMIKRSSSLFAVTPQESKNNWGRIKNTNASKPNADRTCTEDEEEENKKEK